MDAQVRPFRVVRAALEEAPSVLGGTTLSLRASGDAVLEEPDASFCLDVSTTKDGEFLLINSNSKTTSEVRCLARGGREGDWRVLHAREPGVQCFAEHAAGQFWLVSNRGAPLGDYALFRAGDAPGAPWQRLSAPDCNVEELDVLAGAGGRAVTFERSRVDGSQRVVVRDALGATVAELRPAGGVTLHPVSNATAETARLRVRADSPALPDCVVALDLAAEPVVPRAQLDREGAWHPAPRRQLPGLEVRRAVVRGVPVTLTFRPGIARDGRNPLLLQSYGAYGISLPAPFCPQAAALAQGGWVLAHAHLRGGLELGRRWYEEGRLLGKRNTFGDLAAVLEGLHAEGWSSPALTAARSWSAGALALAVLANERPGLVRAMVLRAPFLNVLESMSDPALPLTALEYPEWGDPRADAQVRDYIAGYDPVLNVGKAQHKMPAMLITCSQADQRVGFEGTCRYVDKLRALPEHTRPPAIVLRWSHNRSHFGTGDDASPSQDLATEHAFLHQVLAQHGKETNRR